MANRGDGAESEGSGRTGLSCLGCAAALAVGGVCVVGVLAAIAIPAYVKFIKRSKAAEAHANLRTLYMSAAAYYDEERGGVDGAVSTRCTVGAAITPARPGPHTVSLAGRWPESFTALGFSPTDPLYYQYEIVADAPRCGVGPHEAVYTFRAYGDLDGDGRLSTFEQVVGTDEDGELDGSAPPRIVDELE